VLAWLLGEPAGEAARRALAEAELVIASDLTLIECDRVLIRAQTQDEISEAEVSDRHALLNAAAGHWQVLRIDTEVVERARRSFPLEPIRTLDALHLASALVARGSVPGLVLLTLDERIRNVGRRLGFQIPIN
jgi:predicted nucleic acid-binding protein